MVGAGGGVGPEPALSFTNSNDDIEEGDPGSDSDFEIDAKKDVSRRFG